MSIFTFSTIGKIFVIYIVVTLVPDFYWRLFRTADWSEYEGEWAIVTGSSYGIGSEFAFSLAKRGINVVLAARTKYKLEELKKEINEKYPKVKVKVVVMDVLQDGWEKSLEEIKDINISILINNIGGGSLGTGTLHLFHEYPYQHLQDTHKYNIFSMQKMIHELLPNMVTQKKGRIINVSSQCVIFPYKLGVYPGDKSFMNTLTQQLNIEYENFGIRSEALIVGQVSTPTLGNKEPDGFLTCKPIGITENALDLWGWYDLYTPYWGHALSVWATQNLAPRFMITQIEKNMVDSEYIGIMESGRKIIEEIHGKEKKESHEKKEL